MYSYKIKLSNFHGLINLGHKKTVLFITHCGMHGVLEAIYNAVPMVGIPVFIGIDLLHYMANPVKSVFF